MRAIRVVLHIRRCPANFSFGRLASVLRRAGAGALFAACEARAPTLSNVANLQRRARAKWKAKVAAGEWFIYAEPKVAYDADSGVYELRVKKTPCKNPRCVRKLQRPCKRLAEPFLSPCRKGIEQGLHIKKVKRLAHHIKLFGAIQLFFPRHVRKEGMEPPN